jgi:hypothetical protein
MHIDKNNLNSYDTCSYNKIKQIATELALQIVRPASQGNETVRNYNCATATFSMIQIEVWSTADDVND